MSGHRPHHNLKPTGLQAKILRAMVEDTCAIQKGAIHCVLIEPRGRQVRVIGNYTMQALLKTGWIESDPEDRRLFRISASGRAALSPAPRQLNPAELARVLSQHMLLEACGGDSARVAALESVAANTALSIARNIVASGATYLVVDDGAAIMCMTCGRISHNRNDVANRYCGACHKFLETRASA